MKTITSHEIEPGHVIRFTLDTPDDGDTITTIQGTVLTVLKCADCEEYARPIITIDHEDFILEPEDTVEVLDYVDLGYRATMPLTKVSNASDLFHKLAKISTDETESYALSFSGIMQGYHVEDLGSWRGSYDVLSASFYPEGTSSSHALSLSSIVSQLHRYSNGALLRGYKGGTYTARMNEYLYVANSGESMPEHLYNTNIDDYVAVTGFSVDHRNKTVYLVTTDKRY